MISITQSTFAILQSIVTPQRISGSRSVLAQHARDQSPHAAQLPEVVVWPQTTAEVRAIMKHAGDAEIPVTAWGAGTSLEGNPIPVRGGIVLNLQQMNQIVNIHNADFQITVQPGILYKDMNKTLARNGLFFAPDPGANASVGGMLANNAAGIRTVKYGATRDNVLALEVVLANGDILRTGSRSIKQSSGYDLTHLFVGSEGTLGIITEATLKLAPLPEHYSVATVAFPSVEQAAGAVYDIIGSGLEPSALELLDTTAVTILNQEESFDLPLDPNLFMEFGGASEANLREILALAEEICREHHCYAYRTGIGRSERTRLWEARHRLGEILFRVFPGHNYLITDVAVPISHYPLMAAAATELLAEMEIPGTLFGHAGDGNIHTAIFYTPDDLAARDKAKQFNEHLVELALKQGGTSTGEHGIGIGKQQYMLREHGQVALDLMRQLKVTLDPKGILNPGKILAQNTP